MRTRAFMLLGVVAIASAAGALGAMRARGGSPASLARAEERIDYNAQVRPILAGCLKCHGPDTAARKAGLRLDEAEGSRAVLESGARAIVPGDPDASELLARVLARDAADVMPPPEVGPRLTDTKVEVLRRWVAEGGEYAEHWAFVPPVRASLPSVSNPGWVRSPIDAWVLAGLERAGLERSAEADRATLLRRVSLDLTGLPPPPDLAATFLASDEPGAYEALVDALLTSPAFGEKWARPWLDLARYADTMGYEKDSRRTIWPYRDWVVRALNADMGFDEFTIRQIAGDMLPGATDDDRLATAFHRNTMNNAEGGTDDEEYRHAAVVDRVNTTFQAWMGLTMGCAQCHTHKYDPFTIEEYYGVFAILNTTQDADKDDESPTMRVMSSADRDELASLRAHLAEVESRRDAEVESVPIPSAGAPSAGLRDVVWIDDVSPAGSREQFDNGHGWAWDDAASGPVFSGARSMRRAFEGYSQHYFTDALRPVVIGEGDVLFAHVFIDPADPPKEIMFQWRESSGNWEHRAFWGEDRIGHGASGTASRLRLGDMPPAGSWVRLEIEPARVGLGPGARLDGWAFSQLGGTATYDACGVRTAHPSDADAPFSPEEWEQAEAARGFLGVPEALRATLAIAPADRDPAQARAARLAFLRSASRAGRLAAARFEGEAQELGAQLSAIEALSPMVPIMLEQPEESRRATHVHVRGAYLSPGEPATAGVPAKLAGCWDGAREPARGPTRLDLARWLVDRRNPLTARVQVNRVWEQIFGVGIVETTEDFGTQGSLPSHPELLDWLAIEYMEHGWSLKRLCREIVLSSTYRQSSAWREDAARVDPANRLLWRGARFRLDAEAIRDQALAIGGLLSTRMEGPPVFPRQPDGVWQVVYSGDAWTTSAGEDRYRRGLYTFWRRTSPYPSMVAFDSVSREFCVSRRTRTNTPLQALVTLNDPVYIEAAQGLARRVLRIVPAGPDAETIAEARVDAMVRAALFRPATASERRELASLAADQRLLFASEPARAIAMATDPIGPLADGEDPAEFAAWTVVANIVLNLDEVLNKS